MPRLAYSSDLVVEFIHFDIGEFHFVLQLCRNAENYCVHFFSGHVMSLRHWMRFAREQPISDSKFDCMASCSMHEPWGGVDY